MEDWITSIYLNTDTSYIYHEKKITNQQDWTLFDLLELTQKYADQRLSALGYNAIYIPDPTYFELLKSDVLYQFYVFQTISILLWFLKIMSIKPVVFPYSTIFIHRHFMILKSSNLWLIQILQFPSKEMASEY